MQRYAPCCANPVVKQVLQIEAMGVRASLQPPHYGKWKGISMRTTRIISLTCAAVAVFLARPVQAQDVLIHLHKLGDTLSIKNAPVTIDHTIEAKTDTNGIARIPDLEDGGHVIEATAPGYLYLFDNFNSGSRIKQPIEIEMFPDNGKSHAGPQVNSTPPASGRSSP